MIKCIIFDVDGTLINTEKAILLSLQKTVKEVAGRSVSLEDLLFTFGIPGRVALERLEVPDVEVALKIWIQYSYDFADKVSVFSGVNETLLALQDKGLKIGIVTSQGKHEAEEILKYYSLRNHFDILVSASDTKKHKPDPEPLNVFLQKANLNAEHVIYIGDTIYDQQCARGAGVAFALALWGAKNPNIETSYKLNHPNEILALVKNMSDFRI